MKKMLLGTFLGMFTLAGVAVLPNFVAATDGETTPDDSWAAPSSDTNLIWDGSQTLEGSALLDTIKTTINRLLWILATIALAICLYGWFTMVISAGDDGKYQNGLKVLKNAAIGLAIIGLSWLIISVVFRAIGTMSGGKNTKGTETGVSSDKGAIVDSTK